MLLRSHQNKPDKLATKTAVTAWVLLVLSAFFIGSLVVAIANFT